MIRSSAARPAGGSRAAAGRSPAIITIVSSARQRVARGVRVDGRERAVVAGVHRLEHVERLGAADLADDDPVGPHAQALRTRSRIVTSPSPSMFVGRDSSRSTWRWLSRSSAASSIVTMRSLSGIALESDVQQRRLAGAGTAGDEDVQPRLHARARATRRVSASRSCRAGSGRSNVEPRLRELPDRDQRAAERRAAG